MSALNTNKKESTNLLDHTNTGTSNSDLENPPHSAPVSLTHFAPKNPTHCIYRVPQRNRKINKEAYTPQLISIGPLHYGKKELAEMEKEKKNYVTRFTNEKTTEVYDKMLNFVTHREKDIRECYANTFQLESSKFCKMILNDAIFIILLFLTFSESGSNFFLEGTTAAKNDLLSDLGLLENQLPYFVIKELYKLVSANSKDVDADLNKLCFDCLSDHLFTSQPKNDGKEVKHFTDMRRTTLVQENVERVKDGKIKNLPCAMKLHESGVKFRATKGQCLLDIKCEKRNQLISCFTACTLKIPQLSVFDQTESILRNMMALEQCHYSSNAQVCDYVDLMDRLIDTEKDVELLVGEGIIENNLGDNASVAKMFNKLYKEIVVGDSCYYNICEKLKAHYNNGWNHLWPTLKRVYFCDLWRGTATLAAIILLLLTIIQTVCSILQVD